QPVSQIDLPVAVTVAPKPVVVAPPPPKVVEKSVDRVEQKVRAKRIKKIDEEIAALEARIASAEGDRERNDLLLCSEEVFRDGERVKKIQQQNHDLKAMINLLYGKWETLSKEKEELESAVPSS
ncbi:MAG TPA: ABC transporter C-terminal domain-containing protein, partial [Thermoanaerobaculia bacterium]